MNYHKDKQKIIFLSLGALAPFKAFSESEINLLLNKKLVANKDPRLDHSHIKVGFKELGLLTSSKSGNQFKVELKAILEKGIELELFSEKHRKFDSTGLEKVLTKTALKNKIIKP